MIEVTFRIESLDYTDKLDSQLPLVLEALSQSGNINPVLKLACNTPEASSRIVKGILRTMSQDQKQRLATKIVNANREKLMQKLNEYAAGKGIDVHICDVLLPVPGSNRAQTAIRLHSRRALCPLERPRCSVILPGIASSQQNARRPITGGVFICRGFILPSRACTSLPLFVCA